MVLTAAEQPDAVQERMLVTSESRILPRSFARLLAGRGQSFRKFSIRAALVLLAAVPAGVNAAPEAPTMGSADLPAAPAGTYKYEVRHDSLGKIGSYINEIRHEAGGILVDTEVDISAKILFVRVAREKAERRQFWRDGRLMDYESTSWSGSKKVVTKGRAEGDQFILDGPKGRVVAPADVFPINPWSMSIIKASVLMGEKNGTLHPIDGVQENRETITVDGQEVETRHFKIIGHRDEQIWFDERGIALKFSTDYKGDSITFTLTDWEPASSTAAGQTQP